MPRGNKSKDRSPRHVRLHHYLMQTPAWQSLDTVARCIYIEIATRYAGLGSNNGRISYSVREAADHLHVGKSTAMRALDQLQDRGFVVCEQRGAFSLKKRHATEWRLTEFANDITQGQLATKDFIRWTPSENKTRYPQRNPSVPVAKPIGTHNGTEP
jgi:DNA-binding transcriptional regulator YhcF (GntR family)